MPTSGRRALFVPKVFTKGKDGGRISLAIIQYHPATKMQI